MNASGIRAAAVRDGVDDEQRRHGGQRALRDRENGGRRTGPMEFMDIGAWKSALGVRTSCMLEERVQHGGIR